MIPSDMGGEERIPVTTVAELRTLDDAEIMEGYLDGFAGEPEPGDNRSKSYWHGWRNGMHDRTHTSDAASRALSKEVVQSGYLKEIVEVERRKGR